MTVITFGTFDLFHVGHVRMLARAARLGDRLIVGVSTDQLNYSKKKKFPVFSESERLEIIRSLDCVDHAFLEESLELKRRYILRHDANLLVMGDDWAGRFDHLSDVCEVRYLPRTEGISTTEILATLTTAA